jgi:O-antigen/teichoic acid export membrane protein
MPPIEMQPPASLIANAGRLWHMLESVGEAFVLQVAAAAALLLMHSVVARVVGAEQYGIFSYALLISSFMTVVTTLGLPTGSLRYVAEYNEKRDWKRLAGLLVRSLQLVLITSLTAAAAIAALQGFVRSSALAQGFYYGAAILPLVALGFWRSAAIRGLQHIRASIVPEDILRPTLVICGCFVLAQIAPAPRAGTVIGVFIVAAIVTLAVGFWWFWKSLPRQVTSNTPRYETATWLRTSLPILSGAVLQEIISRADVFMLGLFGTMEATGLYSAAARVSLLNAFALKVVDVVVAPKMAAAFHTNRLGEMRAILKRGTLLSTLGAVPLFVPMMLWPELILGLFGDEFRKASSLLRILAFGQLITAVTGPVGYALLMTGQQRTFAKIMALSAAMNLAGNAFFVPRFGALGAALVTCLTVVFLNVSLYFGVRKKLLRQ